MSYTASSNIAVASVATVEAVAGAAAASDCKAVIHVYTDGGVYHPGTRRSCGAYAYYIPSLPSGRGRFLRGADAAVPLTNQMMHVLAACEGIQAALAIPSTTPHAIECMTSSLYVIKVVNEWASLWERTGWVTKAKQSVKNSALLRRLITLVQEHGVCVNLVRSTLTPEEATAVQTVASLARQAGEDGGRGGCRFRRTLGPAFLTLGSIAVSGSNADLVALQDEDDQDYSEDLMSVSSASSFTVGTPV